MLGSIFLAMSLDFATLTSVKKVRNLQHENLPIQDINFPTKNSKSPDLGSRMYHMHAIIIKSAAYPYYSHFVNVSFILYMSFTFSINIEYFIEEGQ